jgi:peptidoglycan/xylan/chitin deacetylase (PgdA/CDA1 family)
VLRTPRFVAVVAQPGDTLASLAGLYLGDAGRAWEIAAFNGVGGVAAGDELAVPLVPFRRGGLSPDGYQTVPVLSYHHFAERSGDRMTVARDDFEAQMRLLRDKGYAVVSLEQLADFLEFRGQLPEKAVVITIDDGWRSTYDIAWPILRRYGYPATLFVYTQLVTGSAKTLSWEQLREMAAEGLDVECHTVTHRDLARRAEGETLEEHLAAVEREVGESLRVIEQKLGRRPRFLAYPYGSTDATVVAFLRRFDYRGAFTVERAANAFFTSPFRVGRAMIYGDYDLSRFERNLPVADRRALR